MIRKATKKIKIPINIKIDELLAKYPYLGDILFYEYGLHCVNCIISGFDTLREGAMVHQIEGIEFKKMIAHLEATIKLMENKEK